jgi:5-methylcytosine-specific restriction enzyme subunit McrC
LVRRSEARGGMADEAVSTNLSQATIPIRNLYFLLCYAWNHFHEGQIVSVDVVDSPELSDLLAKVLVGGIRHLLRRGIDRSYATDRDDTSRIRGRILVTPTIERTLPARAQAHCEFDELTSDVLHNQILKTTVDQLSKTEPLDPTLRTELRDIYQRLPEVHTIRIHRLTFRTVQLGRKNAFYAFLMNVCELVHDALLPEERTGGYRFRDILKDQLKMARVFQEFVYNFYRLEQDQFKVSSDRIAWDATSIDEASKAMLPSMLTDVSLRSSERTIVVDTKFYTETFQNFYGSETVRSSHLYQLFSYLKNLENRGGHDANAEGLLLYPTVSKPAKWQAEIQGHNIRVVTLDLSLTWREIRRNLLLLLEKAMR